MKYLQKILSNSIVGMFIGGIIAILLISWPTAPRGFVDWHWTGFFVDIGIAWGAICGGLIGIIQLSFNLKFTHKVILGTIVGTISGLIFFLVFGGFLEWLRKPLLWGLWGLISAAIGAISGIIVGRIHWLQRNKADQRQIREKVNKTFSIVTGATVGTVIGSIIVLVLAGVMITPHGQHFSEIIKIYSISIFTGCLGAVYGYVKPMNGVFSLKVIMEGVIGGLIFGAALIVYLVTFFAFEFAIQGTWNSSISFPAMKITIAPTIGLGLVTGIISAVIDWRISRILFKQDLSIQKS